MPMIMVPMILIGFCFLVGVVCASSANRKWRNAGAYAVVTGALLFLILQFSFLSLF